MKTTVYLSRKLLNQLKVKETESKDLMMGGNEEEKRHVCQDIIEGRKKLVGVNEFELVDDNVRVRSLGQKVEELQHKMLVNQIREDMIAHPLNYVDRFAMTDSYEGINNEIT